VNRPENQATKGRSNRENAVGLPLGMLSSVPSGLLIVRGAAAATVAEIKSASVVHATRCHRIPTPIE
jgi:hypothetical protein